MDTIVLIYMLILLYAYALNTVVDCSSQRARFIWSLRFMTKLHLTWGRTATWSHRLVSASTKAV